MANGNSSKKLINTSGETFYGTGLRESAKALSTKYMESSFIISIHSELPENMQSATTRYDYKSGLEIYLKPYTAKMLARLVKQARAAFNEGNDVPAASVTSGSNVIEISDGTKFGLNPAMTLCIYSDIQAADKKTDTYDVYQFTNAKYLLDYDRTTGDYHNGIADVDIEMFIDELNDFVHACNNAQVHGNLRGFSYDVSKVNTSLLQLKEKLGITSSDYKYSSSGNNWQKKGSTGANGGTPMSSDDLMSELDNM